MGGRRLKKKEKPNRKPRQKKGYLERIAKIIGLQEYLKRKYEIFLKKKGN